MRNVPNMSTGPNGYTGNDAKAALEMAQNVYAENVKKWEVDVSKMKAEMERMKAKALADEVEMAEMQSKLFGDYEKMSFDSGNKNAELEATNKLDVGTFNLEIGKGPLKLFHRG